MSEHDENPGLDQHEEDASFVDDDNEYDSDIETHSYKKLEKDILEPLNDLSKLPQSELIEVDDDDDDDDSSEGSAESTTEQTTEGRIITSSIEEEFTRNDITAIVGLRAKELECGAETTLDEEMIYEKGITSCLEIAKLEMEHKCIPMKSTHHLPNGTKFIVRFKKG